MDERAQRAFQAGYTVRPAVVADAERIGLIHVQAWQEAYPGIVSQAALDALDPVARANRWRDWLRQPESPLDLLVGIDPAGVIVGMIAAGPGRDVDAPTEWELWAINVLQVAQGTGLADALVAEAVGSRPTYLWVLEDNPRAMSFYRRLGFVPEGARTYDETLDSWQVRVVRR